MISDHNNPEITTLKNQLFTLLVALIVVSGTLTVYLYREVAVTNKEIAQVQQGEALMNARNSAIGDFVQHLLDYGYRHPDFAPVLKKYNLTPTPTAGAPAPPKK